MSSSWGRDKRHLRRMDFYFSSFQRNQMKSQLEFIVKFVHLTFLSRNLSDETSLRQLSQCLFHRGGSVAAVNDWSGVMMETISCHLQRHD